MKCFNEVVRGSPENQISKHYCSEISNRYKTWKLRKKLKKYICHCKWWKIKFQEKHV